MPLLKEIAIMYLLIDLCNTLFLLQLFECFL